MDSRATVAVVLTRPETILADYERLLRLADIVPVDGLADSAPWQLLAAPPATRQGASIRPGVSTRPGPATTCPPWQLEGVTRALLSARLAPTDLTLGTSDGRARERQPWRTWARVLAGCGVADALSPAAAATGMAALVLANVRTDRQLGMPGSLGALASAWLPDSVRERLGEDPEPLIAAWRRRTTRLAGAVLDATVCGDGPDGVAPMPVAAHVLLAGADPVAVDAIAGRLLGLLPRDLPLQRALAAAGLGCDDPDGVALVGDTAALPASLDLTTARAIRGGGLTIASGPNWWRRWQQKLNQSRPRPMAARQAQRRYESQPWGRLHQEYDQRGTIGGGKT